MHTIDDTVYYIWKAVDVIPVNSILAILINNETYLVWDNEDLLKKRFTVVGSYIQKVAKYIY